MLDEDIKGSEDIRDDISFILATPMQCPVCESDVYAEDLKRGRGRLNASELRDDLFRYYTGSEEFGEVFPLLYSIVVCNTCYTATLLSDFEKISRKTISTLKTSEEKNKRIDALHMAV